MPELKNVVKIGEKFISETAGKSDVLKVIADIAVHKTNENGKRIKPDLLFATDVIMRTFSPRMLRPGPVRDEYERAIDTLFDIRDKLSQTHTEVELLWHIDTAEDGEGE